MSGSGQYRKRFATEVAGVKGYEARISKDTYDKLIGNHEHIEHQSLRKEVVSEFKSQIESYNINENLSKKEIDINKEYGLFPPQPPHLPCEQTSNTNFVISMAWPYYSNLQRASKLFYSDMYDELLIEKYLIYRIGLNKDQVNMAKEIANLIWNSETYQRKIRKLHSDYEQRYTNTERSNALKIMPWKLKIALTLHDFHIDHIVDIVNNNSKKWIHDFDDYDDNDNETYNFDTNDSAQSLYSDNTDDNNSEDNVILPPNTDNNNNNNNNIENNNNNNANPHPELTYDPELNKNEQTKMKNVVDDLFAEMQQDLGDSNENKNDGNNNNNNNNNDTTNNNNNNNDTNNTTMNDTQNADGLSSEQIKKIEFFEQKYPNKNRDELIKALQNNDWDIDTTKFLLDDTNENE